MAEQASGPSLDSGIVGGRRPSLRMFADRPLEDAVADYLGFEAYATALAELIDNPRTSTPLTVAVSAPWGAGKTSLGKLLERRLVQRARERRTRPHAVIWFNAWRHDAAPQLGAAFAADVARQLGRNRPLVWRVLAPLPGTFLRPWSRWWRRVLTAVVLLAGVALLVILVPQVRDILGSNASKDLHKAAKHLGKRRGSILLGMAAIVVIYEYLFRVSRSVLAYVGNPRVEAARGSMDEVARQLAWLVVQASGRWRRRGRRIVIFVDDLERCRPPRAVEVCEVASQLLAHPNVVIVILADMSVIAASADIKYSKLGQLRLGDQQRGAYGRLYLQKLVQIEFDLPPANTDELRAMLLADGEPVKIGAEGKVKIDAGAPPGRVRYLSYLSIGPVGAVAAVAVTFIVWETANSWTLHNVQIWLAVTSIAAIVAPFLAGIDVAIFGWLAGRAEAAIGAEIERLKVDERVSDPAELERRVLESKPARRRQGLAVQLLRRTLVDDSELKSQATARILDYLPPLPRSAKRMANHLRVLLVVAYERKMLGGDPPLTAEHLGKWVVLNERWPDLARALKASPSSLQLLEADVSALQSAFRKLGINERATDLLKQFLSEDPTLGDVLERLVYLQPAILPQVRDDVHLAPSHTPGAVGASTPSDAKSVAERRPTRSDVRCATKD